MRVLATVLFTLFVWPSHSLGQVPAEINAWDSSREQTADGTTLVRFGQVDDGVYEGSRPRTNGDYEFLQSRHVKYMVDLQFLQFLHWSEQKEAKRYGIMFIPARMNASPVSPSQRHVENIVAILRDKRYQPAYFHCALGGERTSLSKLVLQDAPGPEDAVQIPGSGAVPPASASIAGTVRDADGVAVPDVRVTLVGPNNAVDQVVTADSRGAFTYVELVPGIYRVKIAAASLEQSVAAEVVLGAGERRELPIVGTRILTTSTTVHVVATLNEVAQAQVEAQEKQRVLGFLPNYYSSYIWDAAPMTPKLKFKLSLRSTTDPVAFLVAAGLAGVEQKHNTFPGYGEGSEGYAKRFGAAYADTVVSKMVSRAILPTVLHQDPRYFYRGSGSIRSRIFYALAAAVICRGDNGRLQPNYSQVLGNFAASGISNLYRASGDRTASLTFRNALIMTGSGAVENLLREFFSRKLTSNVPAFANGKPFVAVIPRSGDRIVVSH